MAMDPDLAPLRERDDFKKLLTELVPLPAQELGLVIL
jgi:hypothetical protein